MFTNKMIESFKAGEDSLGLLMLSRCGRELVDFDKRTGNRILYWSVVTGTRSIGEIKQSASGYVSKNTVLQLKTVICHLAIETLAFLKEDIIQVDEWRH